MCRFSFVSFLLFLSVFSFSAFGQTPEPLPTPPPIVIDDGDVVKITTNLIQIDVVVTDKNGNQITDLNPEDFEIYENGKRQDISNFSYIFNKTTQNQTNPPVSNSSGSFDIPAPPAKLKLEQIKRTYALVVDDLGLSFENISTVRYSLKKFVEEEMQNGDLVAIVRTGSGIGALQSFTSDKRQLLAAIEKIRWNPQGRGDISAFKPLQKSFADKEDETEALKLEKGGSQGQNSVPQINRDEKTAADFERKDDDFRNANYSQGSLGALSYVIRGMKELPGRKSVMFISEGFQTYVDDTTRGSLLGSKKRIDTGVLSSLRKVAELANRSSVVIYTFDPRGLVNPAALNSSSNRREERYTRDSQQTMRYLAEETGGLPYVDQNKLGRGIRQAVADQSGYYLLGYVPDSDTFDSNTSKFNKFKIKVNRPGLEVRYRSGFFGVTEEEVAKTKQSPTQQIYDALTSPFGANDITLNLNAIYADDEKIGSFIRSLLNIGAKDLTFSTEPNGMHKTNFDLIAMTFGDNGSPIDQVTKNYTIQVNDADYQRMLEKGFVYNLLVPIKKPGAYQFRVALRDTATKKIGAASQFIEVPNLKKDRLTLSSIVLNNFTTDELKNPAQKQVQNNYADGFSDTSVRKFKQDSLLRYDYAIYNAKTNPTDLEVSARLFRDNKIVLEGAPSKLNADKQTDLSRIEAAGAITLGKNLPPGNYILQIIVTDNRAKNKNQTTSQFIDFEIIE